jgi:thioredoxin 1
MVEHLTRESFTTKVFDYETNKEWKFAGSAPAIIDFWAQWCPPCRAISPVLDEIAREYEGKLNVYKVNTDEETEIASIFGVQSIPSLLWIPMSGKPQMSVGALPRAGLLKLVHEVLQVQ